MSTTHPRTNLGQELRDYNHQLERILNQKWGICLRTYKIIKALTQMLGAAAGIFAMYLGADPMTAFTIIAVIISGPEVAEQILTQQDGGGGGGS